MKEFWDERYSLPGYAYGDQPNVFFREQLLLLPPGKILLPAEGEGRNAVYAASLGWEVHAFDTSIQGMRKALSLAESKGVTIRYDEGTPLTADYPQGYFSAIGLIYAHFHEKERREYHRRLVDFLAPGGRIILEAFSKSNLKYREKDPSVGGPADMALLYSAGELEKDFHGLNIISCLEQVVFLSEGTFHRGLGNVIRLIAERVD